MLLVTPCKRAVSLLQCLLLVLRNCPMIWDFAGTRDTIKSLSVMGRCKSHLLSATLSSRSLVLQQDSWRIRLSDSLCRPIHSVPYRNNAFRCHSFRAPGQIFELPGVKAVSVAVTRSYNILQGSPLVFKLVPAFSIIIFALWGVAPLIRQGRSLLFHVRALLEVGS
ncbi:hypothetical protein QQP08_001942 [Theobroma cacao]|nr:hypothetical protein QQP08_001942 [Theobroma cacao]